MMNPQDRPTVSVIIPNYNHQAYLGRALNSVCSQDVPPLEVLVLDDCSTDNSVQVIQTFVDKYPFVKLIRYREKSADWLRAWSEHLPLLKGDYVVGLGADDALVPGFFRAATDLLRNNPGTGVVFANWYVLTPQGQIKGMFTSGVSQECVLRGESLQRQLCRMGEMLPGQLFKPDLFECGIASMIRRDAILWLHEMRWYELGPYCDSMGYAVVGLKHGAGYLPNPYAGFTAAERGNFHHLIYHETKSVELYHCVAAFLRQLDVQPFVPPVVVEALLRKIMARMPPKALELLRSSPAP
jgi:glycosyltransferase involved in cell wall biosynthesis